MTKYHSLPDAIKSFNENDVPIFIPVFEQVSYAKHMVEQLKSLGISNFVLCDNNSTYKPMLDYLDEVSKDHRVCYLGYNFGPRLFTEKEILQYMPDWFVVTDPDLIFNKNLPNNFIDKMMEASAHYQLSKIGFAMEIWNDEACSKFFHLGLVRFWESRYWERICGQMDDSSIIYSAPIDTTFAIHNSSMLVDEISRGAITTTVSAGRVAGNYTCEHMGWWKEQPIDPEEFEYYKSVQTWASTENEKKKLGYE